MRVTHVYFTAEDPDTLAWQLTEFRRMLDHCAPMDAEFRPVLPAMRCGRLWDGAMTPEVVAVSRNLAYAQTYARFASNGLYPLRMREVFEEEHEDTETCEHPAPDPGRSRRPLERESATADAG